MSCIIIESEEDLIDVKPKKRQKSKVVQSLKLKFKKEESSKCKDDQDIYNESGKSIVHVTNEEFNSSEMVFFCIPKKESNVKSLPKKKLKFDIKENVKQKEPETLNQINSENLDDLNSVLYEKNDINTEDTLDLNTMINIPNEIETENIFSSQTIIDNLREEDIKCEQYQIQNNINIDLSSQSLPIHNDLLVNSNLPMPQTILEESNKHVIKEEFIEHSDTNNINMEQCDNHNTAAELTTICNFATTTSTDINKSVLDKNIKMKNEAIDNLSKCYVGVEKPENNASNKQLVNKWTIDEDKIILQTCKRVEDIEVLLETINRRIPQRSVAEVKYFKFFVYL